jgi:hypothetical protein
MEKAPSLTTDPMICENIKNSEKSGLIAWARNYPDEL